MKKTLYRTVAPVMSAVGLPLLAAAAGNNIQSIGDVLKIVCSLIGYVFAILIITAIVMIMTAAFRYTTAGGQPEKVSKANKTVVFAIVAIVVALLAKTVPVIIANLLGINNGSLGLGATFIFGACF